MDFKKLTNENFLLYAMGVYTNPQCSSIAEFDEDINRIKYVKRLLNKYLKTGHIKYILLLNHITILGNVFGAAGASRILFFKLPPELHPQIKTVLLFLNYLEESIVIDGINIEDIPMDGGLIRVLKEQTDAK